MFAEMTLQEATYYTLNKLQTIYDDSEASSITDWVMEHITGSKKAERMQYKNEAVTVKEETQVKEYTERLLQHEPVQYVLNESWFYGLKFYVDKKVLIPRPETEELVDWIVNDYKSSGGNLKILDIGCGSGCIPVSLKTKLPTADIWACDISEGALEVAKRNASQLRTEINFIQLDFLDASKWSSLPSFDIIVSNPPYIPASDAATMQPNVLQYEPSTALFVPNNDPLVFYTAIAEFGKQHLNSDGRMYFEIHENLGEATITMLEANGYTSALKKDMQGKDRMIKAS